MKGVAREVGEMDEVLDALNLPLVTWHGSRNHASSGSCRRRSAGEGSSPGRGAVAGAHAQGTAGVKAKGSWRPATTSTHRVACLQLLGTVRVGRVALTQQHCRSCSR